MSPTIKQAPMRLVAVRCWRQPVTAFAGALSSNLEQSR